jgi:hypothetical protein
LAALIGEGVADSALAVVVSTALAVFVPTGFIGEGVADSAIVWLTPGVFA